MRWLLVLPLFSAHAATVSQATLSKTAREDACAAGPVAIVFPAGERQVFLRFLAANVRAGDKLSVRWLDPSGATALDTQWGALPSAPSLCFLTQLPLLGFDAASKHGGWSVRVVLNGKTAIERPFRVEPDPDAGKVRVTSVTRQPVDGGQMELSVDGSGFDANSVVHIATYRPAGGWKYLAALTPHRVEPRRMAARGAALPPGEYMVLVFSGTAKLSSPARLLIETDSGYRLPFAAGEPWIVTQGPYGSFSHFNRSLHAYDIAPVRGRCIVAMRGGVVHAFDLGLGQTPHLRIFGNYITVAHDNGEFSHYGHLKKGSFAVKTGQRVERGQALAEAGNSGYTLGPGGGHHVHVHVTNNFSISDQSIPFRFEDLPNRGFRGWVVSKNTHPDCDCSRPAGARPVSKTGPPPPAHRWEGAVAVAEYWTDLISVPRGTGQLDLKLAWTGDGRDLDLELISPKGRRYGWYEDTRPLAAAPSAEKFLLSSPEPGTWRIVVRGMKGGGERIPFAVETSVPQPKVSARK